MLACHELARATLCSVTVPHCIGIVRGPTLVPVHRRLAKHRPNEAHRLFFFFSFSLLIPSICFAVLFLLVPPWTYLISRVTKQALLPPPRFGTCLHFFVTRRFQPFLPSSTHIELYVYFVGCRKRWWRSWWSWWRMETWKTRHAVTRRHSVPSYFYSTQDVAITCQTVLISVLPRPLPAHSSFFDAAAPRLLARPSLMPPPRPALPPASPCWNNPLAVRLRAIAGAAAQGADERNRPRGHADEGAGEADQQGERGD